LKVARDRFPPHLQRPGQFIKGEINGITEQTWSGRRGSNSQLSTWELNYEHGSKPMRVTVKFPCVRSLFAGVVILPLVTHLAVVRKRWLRPSHRNLVLRQQHGYVIFSTMLQRQIHEGLTSILSAQATHEHGFNLLFINHIRQPISAKEQHVFIQ
jgi:hypothetical protein